MKRTNWQLLADARRQLREHHKVITPAYGDQPDMVEVTADRIVVVLSTSRMVDVRGGSKITHRGLKWFTFHKVDGTWVMDDPVIVENKLAEPELHMSFGVKSAIEQVAQRDWEDMCHRPGTSNCPMDNLPRQRQGYDY